LARIAQFRSQISSALAESPEDVSILLVIGREDTDDLEAQVRGSRYAWNIRLISTDSLYRLRKLKESLEDPAVERQIREILIPQEFTRLDRIIDLVFTTSEETRPSDEDEIVASAAELTSPTAVRRASFHGEIIPKLAKRLGTTLVKRTRVLWESPDGSSLVSCQVSKHFQREDLHYWLGLKRSTKEALEKHANAFCAFELGSPD